MSADPNAFIEREAIANLANLIERVENLEANDYYRPVDVVGVTSNPPTDAEIVSLLGSPASYNSNMVAFISDTVNSRYWLVYGQQSSNKWFYVAVALAT